MPCLPNSRPSLRVGGPLIELDLRVFSVIAVLTARPAKSRIADKTCDCSGGIAVGKNSRDRGLGESALENNAPTSVSRRAFLSKGAAGVGAAALAGATATQADAQARWDLSAGVVLIGAGVAGLPAAITARDLGASVIVVDENFDIGGPRRPSGGRSPLRGRP